MRNIYLSEAFIRGFSRVIDIYAINKRYPNFYNSGRSDYEALRGDWEHVGTCIKEASKQYSEAVTA